NLNMKLVSLNTNGLKNPEKITHLCSLFILLNFDIVLLQETFWDTETVKVCKTEWKGDIVYSNSSDGRKGVAILISPKFSKLINSESTDGEGRIAKINITLQDKIIDIFSIYAPNNYKDRILFFKFLSDDFVDISNQCIVGGDFNEVLDKNLDRGKNMHTVTVSSNYFNKFIADNNLIDSYRYINPNKRQFTRTQIRDGSPKLSRLDYILISTSLSNNCKYSYIQPTSSFVSDHNFMICILSFNSYERGPGLWIFNNQLLKNIDYVH
ncbi:hypothetical protein LOTGIDRAFT_56145, partial [Lottia gigantea]